MSEEIRYLPLSAVRECPTNPRKTYNQAKLTELADSIKAQGVVQPIVVRPLYGIEGPPADAVERYEVVCGHRRHRASAMAGRDSIPAIVRELTEEDAAVIQLIENAQREDVTALEEAEGFQRLMTEFKVKVPELIKQTGKSKTYIYGRLKLLGLAKEVREALVLGILDAEVATFIARLAGSVQVEAMRNVTYTENGVLHGVSYREAKARLRNFLTDLDEAPFPLDAVDLHQTATACTKCKMRAGNNPDMGDLPPNTCLSRPCYETKAENHVGLRIQQAKAAGQEVFEGQRAREMQYNVHSWVHGYEKLDDSSGQQSLTGADLSIRDVLANLGEHAPPIKLLAHPDNPTSLVEIVSTEALARAQLLAAGKDPDAEPEEPTRPTRRDEPNLIEQLEPAQRAVFDGDLWLATRQAIIARVRTTPRNVVDLRELLLREMELGDTEFSPAVLAAFGWSQEFDELEPEDVAAKTLAKVDELSADDLAAVLVINAVDQFYANAPYTRDLAALEREAKRRLAIAAAYGIDPLTGQAVQAPAQPARKVKKTSTLQAAEETSERDERTGDLFKPAAMLQPLNFAGQFIAASDEAARARIEETVRDICAGTLNPDTDNRRAWADRFSRSNAKPGFDTPDALVIGQGTALAVGTGAANVKALTDLVTTSATLAADERKPQ